MKNQALFGIISNRCDLLIYITTAIRVRVITPRIIILNWPECDITSP